MPDIITRYLGVEILKSSGATVLILFIIVMSNALGRILSDIADGDLPQLALWPVLFSQSVRLFSLVLPIGFFLGIVFAFGRLYKDHEIVVMHSCGMGYGHFYKPVLLVISPVLLISIYSSLWLNPQVQASAQRIVDNEQDVHQFAQVKSGQFNQFNNGDHVFFMEAMNADNTELKNIIISQTNRDRMIFETAKLGRNKTDEATGDLFLVVGPGERYEGRAGEKGYSLVEFEQHGILIEKKQDRAQKTVRPGEKPPAQLWGSELLGDRVELLWRISIPVVLLVLALVAVPLSYIAPRKGRFGKVGYAMLVYIAYLNLMAFVRGQLEAQALPLALNFWPVHLLFIGLMLAILMKRNRGYFYGRRWIKL